jgi:hypothetical protein
MNGIALVLPQREVSCKRILARFGFRSRFYPTMKADALSLGFLFFRFESRDVCERKLNLAARSCLSQNKPRVSHATFKVWRLLLI